MDKHSKRYRKALEVYGDNVKVSVSDALDKVEKYNQHAAKFKETVELVVRLGIDSKKSDQSVRGVVQMPAGTGKSVKIAVVTTDNKIELAKESGADIYGATELLDKIKGGFVDFDVCIATPDVMPQLSKFGKILGPKGLMPNPKLGTVTDNLAQAVKNARAGQVEFKADKGGVVHAGIGKVDFSRAALTENIVAIMKALVAAKPSSSKGEYIKAVYISTSMGPSISVDLSSLVM
jgi:large subunit ribosomal protein L1